MNISSRFGRSVARLAVLSACLIASSFGPRGTVQATPSLGFTSVTISASGVPEIALKTLSATHQVRISTKGLSDVHMTSNVVVPGGYRVTGRQGFSTGCRHATWVAAHAQVIENSEVRLDGGEPEMRYLYVPVGEAELLDTWHVRGMRGTGTHHFAVHDVFVPAERTVLSATAPLFNDGPLYKIPRTLAFASGDAAVALGMSRSCLETFYDLAGSKTPRAVQGLLRDQSMTQVGVGHAEAALRSGRAFLMEAVSDIWHEATTGEVTLERRAALRLASTHCIRLAAQIIESIYSLSGATAAYDGNLIQRHFQDIHVITQHLQGRPAHYELVGRHWLGLPIDQARL